MSKNRNLLIGVVAAVVAAGLVHVIFISGRYGEAEELQQQSDALKKDIEKLTAPEVPVSEALARLQAERKLLDKVVRSVDGVVLAVKAPYQIPKGEIDPNFYFDKELKKVQEEYVAGRAFPDKNPLGFDSSIKNREKAPERLERLSAVVRLLQSVGKAGLQRVVRIRHLPRDERRRPIGGVRLVMIPMAIEAVVDERALIAFVSEISKAGQFLTLESLNIEVDSAGARTFSMNATVSAVIERRDQAPASRPGRPATSPLPIGRY